MDDDDEDIAYLGRLLGVCRELAPSNQESTTYEPSLVCKLLILGCRILIPDRLLALCSLPVIARSTAPPKGHASPLLPTPGAGSPTGRSSFPVVRSD